MRYGGEGQTAAEIINGLPEKDLADIFWRFGEERYSRQIAKKIVEERRKERILTTGRLAEIVKSAVPKNYERGRINPATRVFQALRICANDELENLGKLLGNLKNILKSKGRIAIISFHSLEDRMVKNHFRQEAREEKMDILT
jgi:16S rRNA (cytosine1402-N4)-methyltransferase